MGTYNTPNDNLFINRLVETPLFVLIGTGGGVLGGLFSAGFIWLRLNVTNTFPPAGQGRAKCELLEVAVVSIISSFALFYLPTVSWACKPIEDSNEHLQAFNGNVTAAGEA
mmetsp:Transcript_2714/g.6796  ORF Transcript_2714/g.6796 Transcript_2714/m.6796 type:complete len:111 (-) Transcript_2714:710-1042(-)